MVVWKLALKPNSPFLNKFSAETRKFIGFSDDNTPDGEIVSWLYDAYKLQDGLIKEDDFEDYSFVVIPAGKALERWIQKLAEETGVVTEEYVKVGAVIDLLTNDKKLTKITEELEKDLNDDLDIHFSNLRSIIKNYRHRFAHASEHKLESLSKAQSKIFMIYEIIDEITTALHKADKINH